MAKIVIRASVDFVDGIIADPKRGAVAQHRKLAKEADTITRKYKDLDKKDPSEALAYLKKAVKPYQWKPREKASYLKNLERMVEMHWDKTFVFSCTTEFFEDLTAITRFFLELREGRKLPNDHVGIKVFKVPSNMDYGIGEVKTEAACVGTSRREATCNLMELDSNAASSRPVNVLTREIRFIKSWVHFADTPVLEGFAKTFAKGSSSPPKVITKVQGKDIDEARKRFDDLKLFLSSYGFDTDRLLFEYDGKGNKGTLIVGSGQGQVVSVHEFGHMLGLDDEYATVGWIRRGTGGQPGQKTGHADIAYQLGFEECDPKLKELGPGCVYENNEDVMSLGNMIRPIHGMPFLYALEKLTDLKWKYVTSQVEENRK